MKADRILAIDPGTRTIGFAVMQELELLYYGVKTIKRPKKPEQILLEASRLISGLIAAYQPSSLIIEKMLPVQQNAALLVVVAEEMKAMAKTRGLQVYEYAPATVRKIICGTGKATKAATAQAVVRHFPELRQYLERQSHWERQYWANLFDAVAVALCGYQDRLSQGRTSSRES